jgi:hypothetical protein
VRTSARPAQRGHPAGHAAAGLQGGGHVVAVEHPHRRSGAFVRASAGFGSRSPVERPGEAHPEWVHSAQDWFTRSVEQLDDADLVELRPVHYGPHLPIHRLVSGIAVEHIHHGAEIGLLRDLRRGHARVQPPPIKEEPA